jgi:L-iditol 2-dehydrogenase
MMKALVKTALGEGNLEVLDREEPKVNDDELKIEVKYAGICGSDLHTFEGHYKVAAPVTLGHEFAGQVVEVGANVKDFKVGDRVTSETTFEICGTCRYCKEKKYNLCPTRKGLGTQQDGAFTKYIIARKESVHLLPENVTYLDASITEAAACAYHSVDKAKIEKDDIVNTDTSLRAASDFDVKSLTKDCEEDDPEERLFDALYNYDALWMTAIQRCFPDNTTNA